MEDIKEGAGSREDGAGFGEKSEGSEGALKVTNAERGLRGFWIKCGEFDGLGQSLL